MAAAAPMHPPRRSRARRLAFGWAVATVAVFSGAVSHRVVSGHLPGPLVLTVVWALSGLLCVGLAGIRCRRAGIAGTVLLSQGILHWLLSLSGTGVVLSPASAAGQLHGADPLYGAGHLHAVGHLQHGVLSAEVTGHAHAMTVPMVALHLMAALLTYGAIRQGESAVHLLAQAWRIAWSRLTTLPRPTMPRWRAPQLPTVSAPVLLPRARALLSCAGLRGPPTLFC